MLRLRKLGWRSLDLELPISLGCSTRIVERPGAWMTAAELDTLVGELREIAAAAVPAGPLDYGVFTGDREQLARAIVTVVYGRPGRRPLAFSAMMLLPVMLDGRERDVLHLGLALVRPDARGRRLSRSVYALSAILAYLRNGLRPVWVTNVSQVPSAIGSVATYFDDVHPRLGPSHPSPAHHAIAAQLMAHHRGAFGVGADAEFDPDQFVIRNAYTGGSDSLKKSHDAATRHRRTSYSALCLARLDYDRGDDLLQVGRYSARVLLRCLARRIRHHPIVRALLPAAGGGSHPEVRRAR